MDNLRLLKCNCGLEGSPWIGNPFETNFVDDFCNLSANLSTLEQASAIQVDSQDVLIEICSRLIKSYLSLKGKDGFRDVDSLAFEGQKTCLDAECSDSFLSKATSLNYAMKPGDAMELSERLSYPARCFLPSVVPAPERQLSNPSRVAVFPTRGAFRDEDNALTEMRRIVSNAAEYNSGRFSCFTLVLTVQMTHTILVEESEDDLELDLPPQQKTIYSKHSVRLALLGPEDYPEEHLLGLLIAAKACASLRCSSHPYIYAVCAPSSILVTLLTCDVNLDDSGVDRVWRMLLDQLLRSEVWCRSRDRVCSTLSNDDNTHGGSLLKNASKNLQIAENPALVEENRRLKEEIRSLKALLAEQQGRSLDVRSPAAPCTSTDEGKGVITSTLVDFDFPSPKELRRRRQLQSRRSNRAQINFSHNTDDSLDFRRPHTFGLDSSRAYEGEGRASTIKVGGVTGVPSGETGIISARGQAIGASKVDSFAEGAGSPRAELMRFQVSSCASQLRDDTVSAIARAESTQRSVIEHAHFAEYYELILYPYISFLGRALAIPSRASDKTAAVVKDLLDEHAEGMAAMVADLVDEKGFALLNAILRAGLVQANQHDCGSEPAERIDSVSATITAGTVIPDVPTSWGWIVPPSETSLTRRAEIHKQLLLSGRNLEGEKLRSFGYQLPALRIEALQEETRSWRGNLVPAPNGASALCASGQHTFAALDDYRSITAYNFIFLGEANVGTSSVVACMTSKPPKLFRKCPNVLPTLGVTRHRHMCSLQFSPCSLVPLGGADTDPNLNINMMLREQHVTYNEAFSNKPCDLQGGIAQPRPFTVGLSSVNGTHAINFVEIPQTVLEMGAGGTCTGESSSKGGLAINETGPWWGARRFGTLPSKGAIFFLTYDLTEEMAITRRNMTRTLKNVLGCLATGRHPSNKKVVPFILIGTHSDLLRAEDSLARSEASDNSHRNTLQVILRSQREWFLELINGLCNERSTTNPVLLDTYAVSTKEWSVVGERPRSACDFEALCTTSLQYIALHSPIAPPHFLPPLMSVVSSLFRSNVKKEDSSADVSGFSFASCSLERFWCGFTDGDCVQVEDITVGQKTNFLSFVASKVNSDATRSARKEESVYAQVATVVSRELDRNVSALCKSFSIPDWNAGLKGKSKTSINSGLELLNENLAREDPQLLLARVAAEGKTHLPSGYLIAPVLKRITDWLTYAPYGIVTLLTTLKRYADVSSTLLDGQTLFLLIQQHLGLLPFAQSSVSKEDGKRTVRTDGDSVLSPAFRSYVASQYQEFQLYVEQEKQTRRDAKGKSAKDEVFGLEGETSDGFLEGARTVEAIRHECPVVGLNSERYWPPELVACRSEIIDHVVCHLVLRGILQALYTTPTTSCFSIGHAWKDSVLTSFCALETIKNAALLPRSSISKRTGIVPLGLMSTKENCGGHAGAFSALSSSCGFNGGSPGGSQERSLNALLTRVGSQGLVPGSGVGVGSNGSTTSWLATSGIPSEPNPWTSTGRLLTAGYAVKFEGVSLGDLQRYFSGFVSPELARSVCVGPLRALCQTRVASGAQEIALALSGSLNILGLSDGYGTLIHSARHFLIQTASHLNLSEAIPSGCGCLPEKAAANCANGMCILNKLRCFTAGFLPYFTERVKGDERCVCLPQLISRRVSRSFLDSAGYILQACCDYTSSSRIKLDGSVPRSVAARVMGACSAALPAFVFDVFREWCLSTLVDAANHCDRSLLGMAQCIETLLCEALDNDNEEATIIGAGEKRLWENAFLFSLFNGMFWCMVARDEEKDVASSNVSDHFVVIVGLRSHQTFIKDYQQSNCQQLVSAVCAAISASFLRESLPFNGVIASIEGDGSCPHITSPLSERDLPLHFHFYKSPRLIRGIEAVPIPWQRAQDDLASIILKNSRANSSEGGREGSLAIQTGSRLQALRLLNEHDYSMQQTDVMIAATASFVGKIEEGITALESTPASHLYTHPTTYSMRKKSAIDQFFKLAEHLIEGTREVRLGELADSLEKCF